MREKVNFLASRARDFARQLHLFDIEQETEEDDIVIDERDTAELLASLRTMESDSALWEPESDRWLPRSADASLLQSCIDDFYRANNAVQEGEAVFGEQLLAKHDPLTPPNIQPVLKNGRRPGRFKLNAADPRWVMVLFAKRIKRRRGRAKFPDNRNSTGSLSCDARMLLVGDWGSGIPGAIQVATTMHDHYLTPVMGKRDLHVVHLGDVYYAGLTKEYTKNFLQHWPIHKGEESSAKSWCLPGNHDMYGGGHSFFGMLQNDARFVAQKGSYFLLENDNWQVFGLDSAYEPVDFRGETGVLYGEQAAWFAQKRALSPNKKCLLLTHHQPFCIYKTPPEDFERRFRPVAEAGLIDAWIWGHEHGCVLYDPCGRIQYPLLLGHGGFPQRPMQKQASGPSVKFEWTETTGQGDLVFGFAVLDFADDHIEVQLVDQHAKAQCSFTIS